MIRKITRGTSSVNGEKTISCTITNPDKVIVILDVNGCITNADNYQTYSASPSASAGVYLSSITTSGITVKGFGFTTGDTYGYVISSTITFSYQIIEFV